MKNSVKRLFNLFLAAALTVVVWGCSDDEPDPDAPAVTQPSPVTMDENATESISFTISTPAGYASASANATGGQATVTSEPADGDLTGAVEVSFVADAAPQGGTATGSITLTVTDAAGKTGNTTVVLTINSTFVEPTWTTEDITETRTVGGAEVEFKQTRITGTINKDFTMTNDVAWILNGRVIVGADATLTIEEGTIVKGENGQGALASVLLVARDGNIEANGTASSPIVFTSILDNINVGEFESTLDLDNDLGLWGGVLILGNAPIVAGASEEQIEGIPSSVAAGLYGGTDATDDSGSFTYASIRFTGQQLGPGNELQGLTLGGVGSGTTIDHVESINSADDGIEIFGGTVNISNFIVLNPDDDGYDADQGWSGTATNIVYIGQKNGVGFDSDHPFELDGPEGDDEGDPEIGKFRGGTAWGRSASDFADLRDGAQYDMQDVYFFGFNSGVDLELDADGTVNADESVNSDDPTNSDNYATDVIIFSGNEFNTDASDQAAAFTIGSILNDKLSASLVAAKANQITDNETVKFPASNAVVTTATKTKGADVSVLSWSYTAHLNLLSGADFQ
ncbi:MAG: hypothetical protein HWE23_00825 [Rhodobacteraceae bacterium]|nr:hypothetical protein [Paracoccaceae bacterium]